ncbi:hypothetical protein RD792_000878 [Penstemon davidsonii]|uniref:Light-harvesting complex-like protein OHP2, chloroplastic n=1 Tax=Penstemon davidsonii TaxID=160366 RepID=A0ABR0DLX7_9LAMI|nr:hypothetical protein RD792_005926 [Penstemon davidsonii]KAK4490219.1 hypothetical protein RD792_000878 [Penstemon davidsonii]
MSVASSPSFPCIKLPNPPSSHSSSSSTFKFTIRSSQTEGPLRRPVAPAPLKPVPPSPPPSTTSSPPPPPPSAPLKPVAVAAAEGKSVITLEFQRQKAKELQEYFKKKKLEEADQGPFFGFIGKNEISNGRLSGCQREQLLAREIVGQGFGSNYPIWQRPIWAMFGFAVGMLTEYATGSDFVDQVKILFSNFGILDLE